MAWIQSIPPEKADGVLKSVYDALQEERGFVPNVHQALSLKPAILRPLVMLTAAVMHRPATLSRAQREMIAVVVSGINRCDY